MGGVTYDNVFPPKIWMLLSIKEVDFLWDVIRARDRSNNGVESN